MGGEVSNYVADNATFWVFIQQKSAESRSLARTIEKFQSHFKLTDEMRQLADSGKYKEVSLLIENQCMQTNPEMFSTSALVDFAAKLGVKKRYQVPRHILIAWIKEKLDASSV